MHMLYCFRYGLESSFEIFIGVLVREKLGSCSLRSLQTVITNACGEMVITIKVILLFQAAGNLEKNNQGLLIRCKGASLLRLLVLKPSPHRSPLIDKTEILGSFPHFISRSHSNIRRSFVSLKK